MSPGQSLPTIGNNQHPHCYHASIIPTLTAVLRVFPTAISIDAKESSGTGAKTQTSAAGVVDHPIHGLDIVCLTKITKIEMRRH